MSRHHIPLTYAPKIEAVFNGDCWQTIRLGERFAVGDMVTLFEWTGKPYRSKWGRRLTVRLRTVHTMRLWAEGFLWPDGHGDEPHRPNRQWNSLEADGLAGMDCIARLRPYRSNSLGEELRLVLEGFHGPFPAGGPGVVAQVLRW